jgi:hypothetical protein
MRHDAFLLFGAAALLLLAGCAGLPDDGSSRVRFNARSYGNATKTSYGTVGDTYVPIVWSENDNIRIYCPKDGDVSSSWSNDDYFYADYVLTDISTEGRNSRANLAPADDNGLVWGSGTESTTFYSVYPKTLGIQKNAAGHLAATVVIPASQSGSSDISSLPLVARATGSRGSGVSLEFSPAFSAFEFTIKSDTGCGDLTLNSFTLSSTTDNVAGTGYYDLDTETFTCDGTPSKSAMVSFSSGRTITESQGTTFTIFTLPVDMTNMSITVNITKGGTTVSRSLKLNEGSTPLTFTAGHYTRIYGLAVKDGLRISVNSRLVDPLDNIGHTINY